MKLYPTSGDSNSSRTQSELPVASSRSSLRSTGVMDARRSRERKEDLYQITARRQLGRSGQLRQRADTPHYATAEEDKPIAYAVGIAKLVDRQHQRAPCHGLVTQQAHDFAGLTQIEPIERFIHQNHWTRREEPERQQKSRAVSFG